MNRLLREFISLSLKEAAASPEGLALHVGMKGKWTLLVMWDPAALIDIISKLPEKHAYPKDVSDTLLNIVEQWVLAMITLGDEMPKDHWGGREVISSGARKGYGPAIYDLAMSMFGPLYSDRQSVSPSAQNIWDFYMKRGDVKRLPFDDIQDPKTPPREDDSEIYPEKPSLNAAYMLKSQHASTRALLDKNNTAVKVVAEMLQWDVGQVRELLLSAGDEFFGVKYGSNYY